MSNNMDIAFEIFSPRPKKNDFNKNEIERLNTRKEELITLRDEFVKQCMVVEEDIVEIREALGEDFDEDLIYDVNENKEEMVYGFKILDGQEIEKQELAADINDSLYNKINNLIYKSEMACKIIDVDKERAKLELEMIAESLREMSDNVKNIVYRLKPADYNNVDLSIAIERMINLIKLNTEMTVNYNISGDKVKLSPVIEMTLLRIVQEATDNSLKYSEGKNLNVNLIYGEDSIKLEIQDDGKGIDFEKSINDNGELSSFGLSMMRERTYLLGGDINIETDTKGTIITIVVPINV